MAYTNRKFRWDFDMFKRFYDNYVKKAMVAATDLTAAEQKQARANLGFGNGDIDDEPTPNSDNLVKSGGVFDAVDGLLNDVSYSDVSRALLADGTFGTNTTYKHAAIEVNAGEKYIITNMQDLSGQDSYTRYAFATSKSVPSADPVDGKRHVPFVEGYESVVAVPVGGWDIIVIPEGCTYLLVNYGETYPLHVKNYQFIDNKPIYKGEKLVRNGVMMDSIIQSNYGYVVLEGYGMNRGGSGGDARVNFGKYSNLTCVVIRVPDNAVKMYINGEIPSVKSYSGIFYDDFEMPLNVIYSGQDYPLTHFRAGVVPEGTKLAIFNVKEDDYVDGVLKPFDISYDYADLDVNGLLGFQGKKVSIIGASVDTFGEYSYGYDRDGNKEQNNRYYRNCSNNVRNVLLTWWMQLIKKGGGVLERNNSIGSSGVSRNEMYGKTCFLDRYNDLGNPDIILVHGGANEPSSITYKDFDPTIPIGDLDEYDFTQSYDKLIRLLMLTYPNARIIILYSGKVQNKDKAISTIAKYYQLECIEYVNALGDRLTFIPDDTVHPDSKGMKAISDLMIDFLLNHKRDEKIDDIEKSIVIRKSNIDYNDDDVLSFITDEENKLFAKIYKDGRVEKLVHSEAEKKIINTINFVSGDSPHEDSDVLKYLTDENDTCYGYIKKDGTVVVYKLEVIYSEKKDEDEDKNVSENKFASVLGLVSMGVDNIEMSRNPKMFEMIGNLLTKDKIEINTDNKNTVNLRPRISIIDDDTIDNQIPISQGHSSVEENKGGYFSVLLPMMLSLGGKYHKKLQVGLACEGHRVGLTPIYSSDDTYSGLNENGRCVKWIAENMGWNVLNHSMTAQLCSESWCVDNINSSVANEILAHAVKSGNLYAFHRTNVLDLSTGKWYAAYGTPTEWVELTPTKKYGKPFYRDYVTKKWYFNRDFDFDYSWGEWFKRADELGLPHEKVIVHNGSTTSVYMISAGRKYAYWSVHTSGVHNFPPLCAAVKRTSTAPTSSQGAMGYNVYHPEWVRIKKEYVDYCIENKTWMIFMSHFNDQDYHRNYYLTGINPNTGEQYSYPDKDDDYPDEWIIPLKHDEIIDLINGVHDYISTPPSRLNISSWDEWYPAPGTQLAAFYEVLEYALDNGVEIVSPIEGWRTHGNILNIGVDRNGQTYTYDSASKQTPYTEEEESYLTIGADMSIRYYNNKQQ